MDSEVKVKMTTPTQNPPVQVGQLYGLPGYTDEFEQYENLNSVVTELSQSAQTPFAPSASFMKTDVVFWWEQETFWTEDVTYSAGTLVNSPQGPYNLYQTAKLKMQGQYSPIELANGMQMAFFQMLRPMRGRGQKNMQDLMSVAPAASSSFANALIPQANLAGSVLASSYTSPAAITSYPFFLEWPSGIYLDEYWDLAIDGTLLPNAMGIVAPMAAFVSPQYMGGGERVIVPSNNFAAGIAANYDQGPLAATAALTVTAFSGSVTTSARRIGVYSTDDPRELPPIFNWQYRRASKHQNIGAAAKVDLPITEYGQVLSVGATIFDPSLGTNNVGGYYNVANIAVARLIYGSNLPRFDDDIPAMQSRFIQQHGFLPPQGTVFWDLIASRKTDKLTNARALNTLTNANVHIHLEFNSTPGASAYAEILTELLVPVSKQ